MRQASPQSPASSSISREMRQRLPANTKMTRYPAGGMSRGTFFDHRVPDDVMLRGQFRRAVAGPSPLINSAHHPEQVRAVMVQEVQTQPLTDQRPPGPAELFCVGDVQ